MTAPASIDEYMAGLDEESRAVLQRLREAIRTIVPEATETISYQIPTVKLHGRSLVAYAAFKDHCSLFPMSMSIIDALRDELEPYLARKGTLHFRADRPLPDALVERIITARIQEIAARRR